MSGRRGRGFLLPPRPRLRDWPLAGAGAGLLLGGCELALSALCGAPRPPASLLALALGFDAAAGAGIAALVALALRSQGLRLCYSAVAGAIVGVQGAVASADLLLGAFTLVLAPAGAFAAVVLSGLAAVAAGAALAKLGERLERSGLPLAPLPLWLASGAVLALAGAVPSAAGRQGVALGAAVGAVPLLAWLALAASRSRGVRPRVPLPGLALRAALAVFAGCALELAWPWLRYGDQRAALPEGPPSVVLVSAGPELARETAEAAAELIGWHGLRYSAAAGTEAGLALGMLRLSDGRSLAAALRESGYSSASLHAHVAPAESADFAEVDAAAAPLAALARTAPGLRGLAWLHCCAARVVQALRLDAPRRTPAELTRATGAWLLDWRARRAGMPFVLWVDYRSSEQQASGLIAALSELLRQIDQHEVGARALVVLVLPAERGERSRAVLRVPQGWPVPDQPARVPHRLRGSELADALLAATRSDGRPQALPGSELPGRSLGLVGATAD